ncbi:GPGG-motif small membrane protein [Herbidospora cretacea]|uniref:GPGG-motif small membrane protein n=1 Tax=Herbidospora cretacea TaxID=28444 RepID=UPI0007733A02
MTRSGGQSGFMATLLWIIAVVLVIAGIYVILARRDILWGIVLIVLGFLVGPGGVSIFNV